MDSVSLILNLLAGILIVLVGGYILLKVFGKSIHYNATTKPAKIDKELSVNRVKFLQVDIQMRPKLFHLFKNEYNNERAQELLKLVKDFDVVAVNEIHSSVSNNVVAFVKGMRELGFKYSVGLPNIEYSTLEVVDGGLILFSKLPILKSDTIKFALSSGQDMLVGKGTVYAQIQTTPENYIHVLATNLQSLSDNSIPECQSVRMNQLRETLRLINKNKKDLNPIVILGNFNIDANNEECVGKMKHNEYQRMFKTLQQDGYQFIDLLLDSTDSHPATYGAGDKTLIDSRDINSNMCNDYIILLNPLDGPYSMDGHITEVNRLECDNKHFKFVSPHFGVQSEIAFSQKATGV